MADNKILPPTGTGTADIQVATDEIAGVDYQKVKLVDGTADSTAVIPGDATNGLDVDVTRLPALPAGTNNIGDVDVLSSALPTGAATAALQTQPGVDIGDVTVNNGSGAGAVPIQDGGNAITVDATDGTMFVRSQASGTFPVSVPASASNFTKAEDAASADLDVGVPAMARRTATPANTSGADLDYEMLQMAAGRLWTSATIDAAIPAGGNNIGDVDVLTLPNVTLAAGTNTNEVVGDAAHDAAAAGNPLLGAGIAQDSDDTAPPNRVSAEGDATRLATDRDGAQFVRPHGAQSWSYHSDGSAALTDATVHAAPGAGLSLYVGTIVVSTGAATALNVFFEEGAAKVLGPYYLEAVAGRGIAIQFNPPKKITANTALTVTTSAAIAQSVDVTGFTAQG